MDKVFVLWIGVQRGRHSSEIIMEIYGIYSSLEKAEFQKNCLDPVFYKTMISIYEIDKGISKY